MICNPVLSPSPKGTGERQHRKSSQASGRGQGEQAVAMLERAVHLAQRRERGRGQDEEVVGQEEPRPHQLDDCVTELGRLQLRGGPPTAAVNPLPHAGFIARLTAIEPPGVDRIGLGAMEDGVGVGGAGERVCQIAGGGGIRRSGEAGGCSGAGGAHGGIAEVAKRVKVEAAPARLALSGAQPEQGARHGDHVGRAGGEPAGGVKGRSEGKGVGDPRLVGRQAEAVKAAEGRGHADRAAGVCADGKRYDPGRHRGR